MKKLAMIILAGIIVTGCSSVAEDTTKKEAQERTYCFHRSSGVVPCGFGVGGTSLP